MKVTYSVGARVPGGGVGNVSAEALKALAQAGWLDKLFCFGYKGSEVPQDKVVSLPFDWPQKGKGHRFFYPDYLKDVLFDLVASRKISGSDFFHSWNNHCLRSLRVAKKLGAKAIVERNSLYPSTQADLIRNEYAKFGIKVEPTSPRTLQRGEQELEEADYIFCPSELVRQSLLGAGIKEGKIRLIPQGVDTKKFKITRTPASFAGPFKVLFIGHLGFRKGLPYLLQAWDKLHLPDSQLVLVGGEEREIKNYLQPFLDRQDIVFAGYTDPKPYLEKATVFVCPSIEDGFGLVVLEAMAAGVPVIVSQNTGAKDVVREGQDGFIVPAKDTEALAERLSELYAKRDLAFCLGQSAAERAREFDWSVYRRKLIETYQTL
ncbi:MAG: glycosyltransferase family 4 protein [bacterium]|nr:glycosyltransferase family 4 protein [bacterium]